MTNEEFAAMRYEAACLVMCLVVVMTAKRWPT